MKPLILAAILIVVLGGGAIRNSRLYLQGGATNVLNFGCGGLNPSNQPGLIYSPNLTNYSYSFEGLPSFLRTSGSRISGYVPTTLPNNQDYKFTVNYTSPSGSFGSQEYILSTGAAPTTNAIQSLVNNMSNLATFFQGIFNPQKVAIISAPASYLVLLPILAQAKVPAQATLLTTVSSDNSVKAPLSPPAGEGKISGSSVSVPVSPKSATVPAPDNSQPTQSTWTQGPSAGSVAATSPSPSPPIAFQPPQPTLETNNPSETSTTISTNPEGTTTTTTTVQSPTVTDQGTTYTFTTESSTQPQTTFVTNRTERTSSTTQSFGPNGGNQTTVTTTTTTKKTGPLAPAAMPSRNLGLMSGGGFPKTFSIKMPEFSLGSLKTIQGSIVPPIGSQPQPLSIQMRPPTQSTRSQRPSSSIRISTPNIVVSTSSAGKVTSSSYVTPQGVFSTSSTGTISSSANAGGKSGVSVFGPGVPASCVGPTGATILSGNGVITSLSSNSFTVNGSTVITVTNCTKRTYKPGQSALRLKDKVQYDGYKSGSSFVAKNIVCQ